VCEANWLAIVPTELHDQRADRLLVPVHGEDRDVVGVGQHRGQPRVFVGVEVAAQHRLVRAPGLEEQRVDGAGLLGVAHPRAGREHGDAPLPAAEHGDPARLEGGRRGGEQCAGDRVSAGRALQRGGQLGEGLQLDLAAAQVALVDR